MIAAPVLGGEANQRMPAATNRCLHHVAVHQMHARRPSPCQPLRLLPAACALFLAPHTAMHPLPLSLPAPPAAAPGARPSGAAHSRRTAPSCSAPPLQLWGRCGQPRMAGCQAMATMRQHTFLAWSAQLLLSSSASWGKQQGTREQQKGVRHQPQSIPGLHSLCVFGAIKQGLHCRATRAAWRRLGGAPEGW